MLAAPVCRQLFGSKNFITPTIIRSVSGGNIPSDVNKQKPEEEPRFIHYSQKDNPLYRHNDEIRYFADEKFDQHFIDYFSRPDIDGWELREKFTDLIEHDVMPDPKVIEAALRACRRLNDFGLTIRILEAVQLKCSHGIFKWGRKKIFAWIMQEIKPVLDELSIPTLEELGYTKPEFFVPDPDWWWEKRWYKAHGYDKMKGYEFCKDF